MEFNWYEIIGYILTVIFGALSIYFKRSAAAQSKVASIESWVSVIEDNAKAYIVRAEKEITGYKRGGERFVWVVKCLLSLLPDWVRPYISKEMIEDIVQRAFDAMADYATTQLDKALSDKGA